MAPKITSSSDRSKRQARSKATVRSDKGRKNRQSVSTANNKTTSSNDRKVTNKARVTNASQRASTGSAKVTRGEKPALPPGQKGGAIVPVKKPARTGNRTAAPSSSTGRPRAGTSSAPFQKALPAAQQGPQPATRRQQAEAKAARAAQGSTGPNRVGQPAGAANRQYGAQRVDAAIGRAQRQSNIAKATSRGIVGGSIAGAILSAPEEIRKGVRLVRDPKGAMQDTLNESGITLFGKGPRTRAATAKQPDNSSRFERQNARVRADRERISRASSPAPAPKSANDGQRTRQAEQRRSSGSVTAAPQPRQSSVRPSQSAPRTATAGAGAKGSKWEDFNPGRGTSETTNPLIKKDSWLMGKIKQREDTQSKNVGPVSDGGEYSASKKSAEIVARRKKKEEEDKKKAQQ